MIVNDPYKFNEINGATPGIMNVKFDGIHFNLNLLAKELENSNKKIALLEGRLEKLEGGS